jgi:hypothetical protein
VSLTLKQDASQAGYFRITNKQCANVYESAILLYFPSATLLSTSSRTRKYEQLRDHQTTTLTPQKKHPQNWKATHDKSPFITIPSEQKTPQRKQPRNEEVADVIESLKHC